MSNLDKIAKETNTTKSTVSKVLNHCAGVDYKLRDKILESAKSHMSVEKDSSDCDIYIILPDNPKYFWAKAHGAISKCGFNQQVKLNLYSHIRSSESILDSYLDKAEQCGAKVLIIAGILSPSQLNKIEKLCSARLTIFLSIENQAKNAFFIGADSFTDGYNLAQEYKKSRPMTKKFLLISLNDSDYSKKRSGGFAAGIGGAQIQPLKISAESSYIIPSVTARELSKLKDLEEYDCVVSIDGITQKIHAGISKLKLKNSLEYIGFECSPSDRILLKSGQIKLLSCQDIGGQMSLALEYASVFLDRNVFPDKKENFVPSSFSRGNNKTAP